MIIEMQNPNIDITMYLQNKEPFLSPKVVDKSNFWKEKENPGHYWANNYWITTQKFKDTNLLHWGYVNIHQHCIQLSLLLLHL